MYGLNLGSWLLAALRLGVWAGLHRNVGPLLSLEQQYVPHVVARCADNSKS